MIRIASSALACLLALTGNTVLAATCSCAGAPLLSSLDAASTEQGDLYISFTSEVHEISDLVQGSDEIEDATGRERSSFSQVLSFSYGISDRWSVSGLVSHIEHTRRIGAGFGGEQKASGLGDSVLLLRYTPLVITPFSRHEVALGLGARIATGKDDLRNGFITFSEDMQPSVGTSGAIAWASHSYAFNQAATLTLNTSANYTWNDEENDRGYTFGDDFNFAVGASFRPGEKINYSAGLRYRSTGHDTRFGNQIPNTGGEWVDFVPGISYSVNNDFTVGLSGRIPVYRDLDGVLQFTTTYSYALSLSYGF